MWVETRVQRRRVECCPYICRWVEIADACTQPGVSRPALPNEQLGLEVGGGERGGAVAVGLALFGRAIHVVSHRMRCRIHRQVSHGGRRGG